MMMRKTALAIAALFLAFVMLPSAVKAAEAASMARSPALSQSLIGSLATQVAYKRWCRDYRCYYCKYRRCDYYGKCRYSGCYWTGGHRKHRRHYRRRGYGGGGGY